MRGDVGADARLVEGVDIGIGTVEHTIKFEDVTVSIGATKLVAGSLGMVSVAGRLVVYQHTSKQSTKTFFCRVVGKSGGAAMNRGAIVYCYG